MLTSHGQPCHSCMEIHARMAWRERRLGGCRGRRRPGDAEDDHGSQAVPHARHAGSLRNRPAGRRALGGRVLGGRGGRSRCGRARPEEGARPRPRHRDHPRPLHLPGPRPASRPALHSREHRPPRHAGRHPVHHLQEGVDGHGPAARAADRAVQEARRVPRLRSFLAEGIRTRPRGAARTGRVE